MMIRKLLRVSCGKSVAFSLLAFILTLVIILQHRQQQINDGGSSFGLLHTYSTTRQKNAAVEFEKPK